MELGWRSHPGMAPSHGANRLPPGRSAPTSAGVGAGVEETNMQTPLGTPPQGIRVLAGSSPRSHGRSLPHATCSHSVTAGGGTPARGRSAVHTSRCPQTGQHSGCASPRAAPARCHSHGGGASTGPWPNCCRHTASAAPCVWAYRPQPRTSTAPGGGTCSRQRPMNCSRGNRIVRCCARPPGPLARSSYRKTTCWPSHAHKRAVEIGPPRR
jgi:hypothetical protein